MKEIRGLSSEKIRELLDFVYFLKAKAAIDPFQMNYRTREWQRMEPEADSDKKKGNIIANGSVRNLLKQLKKLSPEKAIAVVISNQP